MPRSWGASPWGQRSKAAGASPAAPGGEWGTFSLLGVEGELFAVDLRAFAASVMGITLPSLTA